MEVTGIYLKDKVMNYLETNGYSFKDKSFVSLDQTKQKIRELHSEQRRQKLLKMSKFIDKNKDTLSHFFADGEDVDPERIDPKIIEVKSETKEGDLFRFATLNWSVPVSNGFGRRMRFIVIDKNNGKLIGILGLGDPVFNLRSRDQWIGWEFKDRIERLVNVMDAFVLGALPPYSNLIGGKLIAALTKSRDIQKVYSRKYGSKKSLIRKRVFNQKLALITTSSALGKSSIYDRLNVNGEKIFNKIGETSGYGHFHVPDELFTEMREYLKSINHPYANGNRFGNGPNWKFRVIRKALYEIGLNEKYLCHGIKREVYAIPLAHNTRKFLNGQNKTLRMNTLSTKEITSFCKNRWIIPRSERDDSYREVKGTDTMNNMIGVSN